MHIRHLGPSVVVDAPGKLNLFLDVLQQRQDGYHELETVMVAVNVYDTLRLTPIETASLPLRVTIDRGLGQGRGFSGETVPADRKNLCLQAAELLRQESGAMRGAAIELHKRIPPGSGMGGGSSDAAATLVGLNLIWGLNLTRERLHQLAARLGSDVNFFLESASAALCRGRGEQVQPLPGRQVVWFVVATPEGGLSTASVFRELRRKTASASTRQFLDAWRQGEPVQLGKRAFNALQEPAVRLHPGVGRLLGLLARESRIPPQMTGSGSACFALCGNVRESARLAARIRAKHSGPVWICRSEPGCTGVGMSESKRSHEMASADCV